MMSGVQAQALSVSNGAVNGARAAYGIRAHGSQEHTTVNKHTRTNSPRGVTKGSMSRTPLSSVAANGKPTDPAYLQSVGRKNSSGIPNSGSEADSLLDLYGRSDSHRSLNGVDSDIPENMYKPEEKDPEGWIHRDKLAKIESEELQAAGINLANARRTVSKTGRRTQTHSRDTSEAGSGAELNARPLREEKQYHRTPLVVEDPEEEERKGWDLRSPEEIAAEEARSQHPLRKTGSRIPILTSSPLPIPAERVERDTPLPRKRTLSGSMSPDDVTSAPKIRPRQNSFGSGMMLDDKEAVSSPGHRSVSTPSPSKSKTAKGSATASPGTTANKKVIPHIRKISATVKPSGTGSPNQQRPAARSGEGDRPRTAVNRPEGDPPWLATMYKPDPRLPPDQQIIPTHARKQQQAQWTEEGAIPSTYDREFAPLAVHTAGGLVQLPSPAAVAEKPNEQEAWPLKPMPSVRSNNSAGRPGTSGSQTAGYSTMPKVSMRSPGSSVAPSPVRGTFPSVQLRMQQQQQQQQRRQQFDEENPGAKAGQKEKGCLSCCVIM